MVFLIFLLHVLNELRYSINNICLSVKLFTDNEIIIGVIITNWANIIIVGVYSKSIKPNKPDDENNKYKISPTTTGGKLIKEFDKIIIILFPIKLLMAMWLDNIIERIVENTVAIIET